MKSIILKENRIPVYFFSAALMAGIFAVLPESRNLSALFKGHAISLVGFCTFACFLFSKKHTIRVSVNWLDVFLTGYVIYKLIHYLLIGNVDYKYNVYVSLTGLFFYFLFKSEFLKGKRGVHQHIAFYIFCSIILVESIVGILQHVEILSYPYPYVFDSKAIGTMTNPNKLAVLLVSLSFLIRGYNPFKKRWIPNLMFCLTLAVVLITKSRCCLIIMLVAVFLLNAHRLKIIATGLNRIWKLISILLCIGVFSFILYYLIHFNTDSNYGRFYNWTLGIQMFQDHPVFGIGQGNYMNAFTDVQKQISDNQQESIVQQIPTTTIMNAQNQFLQILIEEGLLGFMIFIAILSVALFSMYRTDHIENKRMTGTFLALLAFILYSFVESIVENPVLMLILFYLLSDISTGEKVNLPKRFHSENAGSKLKSILPIGQATAVLLIVMVSFEMLGVYHWNKGKQYCNKQHYSMGIKHFEKAGKILGNNAELKYVTAMAYLFNNNYHRAIELFNACENNFRNKEVYLYRGMAHKLNNQIESAITDLSVCTAICPEMLQPKMELGELLIQKGEKEKGTLYLREILEYKPKIRNTKSEMIRENARLKMNQLN